MSVRWKVLSGLLGVGVFMAMGPRGDAQAAFPAETLEGIGPNRSVPEVHVGLTFDQDYTRATIAREFLDQDGNFDEVRDLDYEEIRRRMVVQARVGLVDRLELRANMPFVLQWDSDLDFADGVDDVNSTVCCSGDGPRNSDDPDFALRFPLTDVPQRRNRAGVGDLELGLAYSPVVDGPDRAWPSITFAVMVTLPTGERWDPADPKARPDVDGTGGVGLGQTIFDLSMSLSKRSAFSAPAFDPYFTIGTRLPIATGAQEDIGLEPPITGRIEVGSEIVIAEDSARKTYYGADFGVAFRYVGEGRTFSPLTDYLPNFNQTNLQQDGFAYDDFANPENYAELGGDAISCGRDAAGNRLPCGEFTRVEDHVEIEGRVGFRLEPTAWLMLRAGVAVGFANVHLITGEAPGEDTDPASAAGEMCGAVPCLGRVNQSNSRGEDERSEFYDPRYDAPGGRFLATDIVNVRFFATATATF